MSTDIADRKLHLIQGEYRVSADPRTVITTILGSCVAACLHDPVAGIGGMNHFLLPRKSTQDKWDEAERVGVHLMELLVNALMRAGAQRNRLEAKLFGGARMIEGLSDVGSQNAAFAEAFIQNEGIRLAGSSLRGLQGRRVQFWPASGRARQSFINVEEPAAIVAPRPVAAPLHGDLELF